MHSVDLVYIAAFTWLLTFGSGSNALQHGILYRLTSAFDDHVITVSSPTSTNVTIEPWQDGSDQKWLAAQASAASDNYFLLVKRQMWDWNKFVKDRRNFLPNNTVVMAEDSTNSSLVTQEGFNGSKSQQWKYVNLGQGKSIIKNLHDVDKCLYNPGQPKTEHGIIPLLKNTFTWKKDKVHPKVYLFMKECNSTDEKQQWIISRIL